MDKRLAKMLLDPSKLESLVKKYEAAAKSNKDALDKLTQGKSLKKASDEWLKKAESAKKDIMEAEAVLEAVHKDAENHMLTAQLRAKEIDDREGSISELASSLLEKEAVLNEKLTKFNSDRLDLDKAMAKLSNKKEALDSWLVKFNALLSECPR